MIDTTLDPQRRSWVASANGHADFPLQNLPLGVFSLNGGHKRIGTAIGDKVLDLGALAEDGLVPGQDLRLASLNTFLARGAPARQALRARLSALLGEGGDANLRGKLESALHDAADATMHLPCAIGDYTDFFAGINHATNTGRQFRPDNPLLPNYKHVPIAYHGRASSVRPSGGAVRRPNGQRKPAAETEPTFGPSRNLDYELEFGIWVAEGNALGEPVPIAQAGSKIAGFCLLNDWSARDIQGWEYQPLGPFLAKSFHTTISPWIVTPEALAPFRMAQAARPAGDPRPLAYLWDDADQAAGALDVTLEVFIQTAAMVEPHRLSVTNTRELYWTFAQLLAHHASGGCNLQTGDLFGSGTISSADPGGYGSLLEITRGGREPVSLPGGETRRFLEDGDTVIFRARAERPGAVTIGFGECRGTIAAAREV